MSQASPQTGPTPERTAHCERCGARRRDVAFAYRLDQCVCGSCYGASFSGEEQAEIDAAFTRHELARELRAAARLLDGRPIAHVIRALAADVALGTAPLDGLIAEARRLGLEVTL